MRTRLRHGWLLLWLLPLMAACQAAVPDFSAVDLQGKRHDLKDYAGKMVVLNFWATWCPPCREELPELAVFHENHKDRDAVVLGVDFENITPQALEAFLEEQMIDYPILPMAPAPSTPFGRLIGLPTSYIIAPDRSEVKRHVGPLTREQLDAYLEGFRDKFQ